MAIDRITASGLGDGGVSTADIADDAVTSAKLGSGAVDTTALGTDAVTTAKVADDAITQALIAAGAVGNTEVASGISASKLTAGNLPTAQMPTCSILQVKSTTKTDTGTLQSQTFTNVSGLSVNITPSSTSSKIFIMFDLSMTVYSLTAQCRIMRDSTAVGVAAAAGNRTQTTAAHRYAETDANHSGPKFLGQFLDSPSTTSQITYQIQGKIQSNNVSYINRTGNDANNNDWAQRQTSTITVMEISA